MSASTVHVEPNPKGRWIVRRDDEREPVSEHESATEAAHIARELAQLEGTSLVLLHDRYARIHHLHGNAARATARCGVDASAPLSCRPSGRRDHAASSIHTHGATTGDSPSTGKTAASDSAE